MHQELISRIRNLPDRPKATQEILSLYDGGLVDQENYVPKFLYSNTSDPLADVRWEFFLCAESVGISIMLKPWLLRILENHQGENDMAHTFQLSFLHFLNSACDFHRFNFRCSCLTVNELCLIVDVLRAISKSCHEDDENDALVASRILERSPWKYFDRENRELWFIDDQESFDAS